MACSDRRRRLGPPRGGGHTKSVVRPDDHSKRRALVFVGNRFGRNDFQGPPPRLPRRPAGSKTQKPRGQQTRCRVNPVHTELCYERWYIPLSVAVGLGPKRSELRVEAGTLHVKMGWAFDAHIPLASITSAERAHDRVLTMGVHYSRGRWLVNGSGKGLVALTIEPPVDAKAVTRSVSLRELWVSVTDPDALIAACTGPRA